MNQCPDPSKKCASFLNLSTRLSIHLIRSDRDTNSLAAYINFRIMLWKGFIKTGTHTSKKCHAPKNGTDIIKVFKLVITKKKSITCH